MQDSSQLFPPVLRQFPPDPSRAARRGGAASSGPPEKQYPRPPLRRMSWPVCPPLSVLERTGLRFQPALDSLFLKNGPNLTHSELFPTHFRVEMHGSGQDGFPGIRWFFLNALALPDPQCQKAPGSSIRELRGLSVSVFSQNPGQARVRSRTHLPDRRRWMPRKNLIP